MLKILYLLRSKTPKGGRGIVRVLTHVDICFRSKYHRMY